MANRFTWICPSISTTEQSDYQQAVMAIRASSGPARAALLIHDNYRIRNAITNTRAPIRVHIIATADTNSIELDSSNILLSLRDGPSKNQLPFILVLIENSSAPDINTTFLAGAMTKAGLTPTTETWPWSYTNLPPDTHTGLCPPLTPRNHPLLRSSHSWYRGDLSLTGSTDSQLDKTGGENNNTPSPVDRIHTSLSIMGITPPGLAQSLSRYHENSHAPDPGVLEKIAKIIYSTSLSLFLKHECFRKWKRKHLR
jgi:hypothetical protein